MLCCTADGREAPRAVLRAALAGGTVSGLWILDTVTDMWQWIPLPLGYILLGDSTFWGMDHSGYKHAVPPPDDEQGPCLPSPAVLLRAPAFHPHLPPLVAHA